jgi:DNA transposition AAA+ family ATPase
MTAAASAAFVRTSVAEVLFGTLDQMRSLARYDELDRPRSSNGTAVGPAGIGKTFAATYYAETTPRTYLLTATAAAGGAAKFIFRRLCAQLHIHDGGTSIADIQQRLFAYELVGHVLIVDEAQNLNQQAIRELLYLSDMAGLTILLLGNADVVRSAHVDAGPLATIGSRIYFRRRLALITEADADALARSYGVAGDEAFRLARAVGAKAQARGLDFVLALSRALAGGGAVTAAHIGDVLDQHPQYRPARG